MGKEEGMVFRKIIEDMGKEMESEIMERQRNRKSKRKGGNYKGGGYYTYQG
jgi:23S rRNA maturation mini-RNase III